MTIHRSSALSSSSNISNLDSIFGCLWGLSAATIWSGWWTVTRVGMGEGLPASDLAALRFILSGLLLAPLAWRDRQAIASSAPLMLALMAIGAGAPYALIAGTGVRLTSAGVGGAMTVGLMPAFTLVLAMIFLGESAGPRRVGGMAAIVTGAACVAAGTWQASANPLGLMFLVLGALLWAGYTIALRRCALQPLTAAAVVSVASLLVYTPIWLFTAGPERLLSAPPHGLVLQAIYQSILSAIGALYCYGRAVGLLGAARASVFGAVVPVFSIVFAMIILRENPSTWEILGAPLLTLGAGIATGRASGAGNSSTNNFQNQHRQVPAVQNMRTGNISLPLRRPLGEHP